MAEVVTMQEFVRALSESPSELRSELLKALGRVGVEAERQAALNATTRLNVRTGRLRASIRSRILGKGKNVAVSVSAGGGRGSKEVKYARIQEEGGTVVPRNGQWLSIPVGDNLTAAGVARIPSPRMVSGLYFVPGRSGNLLAFAPGGRLMFVLVKSVRITAKHYLRDGVKAAARSVPTEVNAAVRRVLEKL